MNDYLPQRHTSAELAVDTSIFHEYLDGLGLPTDNIIASTQERLVVANNLHQFLAQLAKEEKSGARYLSKFVGATAIGLFDAALNYVWNEVVLSLRKKAEAYGIELFFDAAVGGSNRKAFQAAEDLAGLKDSVLLDACRKLELVSDVVYRKLDHILTMRNEVAASHPNVERIGGFELLGWLQTCVRDVLQDKPSQSAIHVKSLVDHIRSRTAVLDASTVQRVRDELKNLSTPHANNLLITVFGIFIDPASDQVLRKNVGLIAKAVWESAEERTRLHIGILVDRFRTNLNDEKANTGLAFLKLVDGLRYETPPARVAALHTLADELREAHDGLNNFHTEPAIMEKISGYVHKSGDIPKEVLPRLVGTVLRCRIGRGVTYRDGVSPAGLPLYDKFLRTLDDAGIVECVKTMIEPDVSSKLTNEICQKHLRSILEIISPLTLSDRLRECLQFISTNANDASNLTERRDFRNIAAPLEIVATTPRQCAPGK